MKKPKIISFIPFFCMFFILTTVLYAQSKSDIHLRFYGSQHGVIKDISRGPADSFYQSYALKPEQRTDINKAWVLISAVLQGPNAEEQKAGIRSAIPAETRLLSLKLQGKTFYADFSKEIIKDGFGDSKVDDITDQLRVAVQNIEGVQGIIYTIEGKSAAYYYPDTKNKMTEMENRPFTIPFSALESQAGGGTPVNQSKVVPKPTNGLRGKNIFIAGGHGWYYSGSSWSLMRPLLYTINEDYSNAATVNLFVIPTLENAGAFVLWARERDTQLQSLVIDNGDGTGNPSNGTYTETGSWSNGGANSGFANGYSPYTSGENPFKLGSTRLATVSGSESARATWTPNIPKEGDYAVYVSFNRDSINRAPDAHYYITHTGGTTQFTLNQQNDGQTWVYLGTYHFDTGLNSSKGSVYLVNISTTAGRSISADAVRFGGGYGLVTRGTSTSGHFRYTEDAMSNAQFSGADDSTVYEISGLTNDYDWDIATRGEYCNWFTGAPNGPNVNRNDPGQGIPIDAMVSFHSDAGSYQTSVHGQLTLWYQYDQYGNTTFPDGRSRQLNYTLASSIHYQTLSDMRALYSSTWRNAGFINGNYGECRRPNVPSIIVESFSHENMNDVQYGTDPQFRFDLARATYKGLLRFLCSLDSTTAVIMPLPPKDLSVVNTGNGDLKISWQPTNDPLESTATAVGYVVYKSTDGRGFDNGTLASTTTLTVTGLQANTIYYFKITAYNTGGESFPTEVLGARTKVGSLPKILVVNGFDRISRPEVNADTTGFPRTDPGVWPKFNAPLIGDQTVFVPQSDASHGQGNASEANTQELGNTFDYVIQHGKAIANAGFWFDSASKKSIEDGYINLTSYPIVDWIAGEQHQVGPPEMQPSWTGYPDQMTNRFKTFDSNLQSKVSTFLASGKNLFVSGAYVSYDLDGASYASSADRSFLNNILKSDYLINDASDSSGGLEVIVDNSDSGFSVTGDWSTGNTAGDKYGSDYRFALAYPGSGDSTAIWRPTLVTSGIYSVYVWYSQGGNRSTDAPYTVHSNSGASTIRIDQQTNGGQWVILGAFPFSSGTTGYVELTNDASGIVVIADAVRFYIPGGGENVADGISGSIFDGISNITFDNGTGGIYGVEQPDGMNTLSGSSVCLAYSGTGYNAGIQYSAGLGGRIVYLGFPFETILSESTRDIVMSRILTFLNTALPVEDWKKYSDNSRIH